MKKSSFCLYKAGNIDKCVFEELIQELLKYYTEVLL